MRISLKTGLLSTIKGHSQAHYGSKVPFLEGNKMDNLDDVVLPVKVDDLIKLLNKVYPEQSPLLSDDSKTIYFKAGQRDVVKFLNNLKEESEK
jgi:hypothetical protein